MTVDLLFSKPPVTGSSVNLVFGAEEAGGVSTVEMTLNGQLPQPALQALLFCAPITAATLAGVLAQPALTAAFDLRIISLLSLYGLLPNTPLTAAFDAQYLTNTARPTVVQVAAVAQIAQPIELGLQHVEHHATRTNTGAQAAFAEAVLTRTSTAMGFVEATHTQQGRVSWFQDATRLAASRLQTTAHNASPVARESRTTHFVNAARAPLASLRGRFQDGFRDRRPQARTHWQEGARRSLGQQDHAGPAMALPARVGSPFQEAQRPPAGIAAVIVVPIVPGYTPNSHMVFWDTLFGTNLVFGRTSAPTETITVVVPTRKVYMVINNASLRRVDGNIQLPVFNMSLALDVDSWTWNFSASLPGQALPNLEPDHAGAPVEVEAMINGVQYRAVVESIGRSREFGKSDLRVQGRGKTALLDSPYAPTRNFTNPGDRTAQQIMGDVLSVNGVPMGWDINWTLDDWLVPAGVFAHQGSYISALNAIAAAAGGYVQPHASLQSLSILPRYAVAPWDWASVTPDFDLPSDVTSREGIEWVERARYNRVFVSGQQSGVLGQVTRAGTAGDLVAPMVTDSLITTAGVARQRGMSILANTGRQAEVTLRLPVLAETGVITPGKFVQYTDAGVVRRGVVRSVAVEVGMPEIWQSIGVETHA